MKRIITIQHTQSIHHTNGTLGAWTDWGLTQLGKKQAENIGRALREELPSLQQFVMFSSDLKRAKQTAEIVSSYLGLVPILRQEIREVHAGIDQPTSRQWFNENKASQAEGIYDPNYRPFPNGESDRELWDRLVPFVQEMAGSDEQNIILVSHGTALCFLFSIWINGIFSTIEHGGFGSRSGGVSKLRIDGNGKRFIEVLNDMSYMNYM